jgi:hypothetical protein
VTAHVDTPNVSRVLRHRANSYSGDADTLARDGATFDAMAYRTVADELRKVATELDRERVAS